MTTQRQHRKAKAKMYETCIICGKAKQYPSTRYISKLEYQRDPYCSTGCCKLDHGLTQASTPTVS